MRLRGKQASLFTSQAWLLNANAQKPHSMFILLSWSPECLLWERLQSTVRLPLCPCYRVSSGRISRWMGMWCTVHSYSDRYLKNSHCTILSPLTVWIPFTCFCPTASATSVSTWFLRLPFSPSEQLKQESAWIPFAKMASVTTAVKSENINSVWEWRTQSWMKIQLS